MIKIISSIFVSFLLLIVIIQMQIVQATTLYDIQDEDEPSIVISGEMIEGIGPLPPCPSESDERYTQTDKKGNKVEVWCDGNRYLMKFTRADGSGGYVGKCAFPLGQNKASKKVNANITMNSSGITIVVEEILQTFWKSYDAPSPGGNGTDRPDKIWVYDVKSNKYIRQNTRHDGDWVFVDEDLVYNVSNVRPDGNATEPADPPSNPDDLACGSEPCPPPEGYVLCETYTPEYELYTPTPITSIDGYGNIETNVYKIPYNKTLVIEKIEAIENQPFIFDVEVPGEDIEIVTFSLINNPIGMLINPVNGIIQWSPSSSQIGYNNVTVIIQYHGLTPDIDEFTLPVLSDMDSDSIPDRDDNCIREPNPLQENFDNDNVGDICDPCTEFATGLNYLAKDNITSYNGTALNLVYDSCSSNMFLTEYYCQANNTLMTRKILCFKLGTSTALPRYSCPNGAGACVL